MAIDCDTAGRPRWEEEGVTDRNTGLTGSTGSRRWRGLLVGRDDGTTTTTNGRTQVAGWHRADTVQVAGWHRAGTVTSWKRRR
ncbi:hypothetical protein E2562_034710 [Oryza meyeriana var. granulata]|uniref:Uncharacterized protein n=1 Tax=Oryza meyeriana var. granulata TaxID=110450 RepID=A0A6G1CB24_9ORYZ|nr:hypothetical protein E2562_034710 [Oryza meyeriana var. granulata]